jgi:EAL domain-containing protein (putative c-di-GMP-specific phosphodiesterase class I)
MIGMAHGLELEVVAEGVETAPQLEFLRALGCEHVQGFLYSRPLPIDQFTTWLTRNGLGAATWAARA